MTTRFGFFIFAGVMSGAILGQMLYYSPGFGLIFGGIAGLLLAGAIELTGRRKG